MLWFASVCVVSVCLCVCVAVRILLTLPIPHSCNTLSHPHTLLPTPHSLLPIPHSLLPTLLPPHPPSFPSSLLPILPTPLPPSSPSSLLPILPPPSLTVVQYLDDLANGNTSKDRTAMKKALQLLLRNTSALEQKWLIRIILKVAARVGGRAIQKGPRT